MNTLPPITVETTVKASLQTVWDAWTKPEHIELWSFADDSWAAKDAVNDLRSGGTFKTHLYAKDNSFSFDMGGTYSDVKEKELIEYDMADGRHVKIVFEEVPEGVRVTETFDPESENSPEMQRAGWQGFMDNFKKYTETLTPLLDKRTR